MARFGQYGPQKLKNWLEAKGSKSVVDRDSGDSTGHKLGRRIVKIKRTNKHDLTEGQWHHMATVVGYIKRHLSQGGTDDHVRETACRYALKNWGHDPLRED